MDPDLSKFTTSTETLAGKNIIKLTFDDDPVLVAAIKKLEELIIFQKGNFGFSRYQLPS